LKAVKKSHLKVINDCCRKLSKIDFNNGHSKLTKLLLETEKNLQKYQEIWVKTSKFVKIDKQKKRHVKLQKSHSNITLNIQKKTIKNV
jgi:hypothetical protein